MDAFLTFTIAAAAAWLGVYAIRRLVTRRHMLDRPNDRSMHAAPTPTGGGLAIAAVCFTGLLLHAMSGVDVPAAVVLTFAVGSLLIAAISWLDDLRPLGVWVRLSAHALAAAVLLWACSVWELQIAMPLVGTIDVGCLCLPAAFFWLLGMTNAYNFMDGVDGMAAAVAVVVGLSWFALATFCGATLVGTMGLLLAAASGGFLLHNRPPARIFMGDVGSAFLGFSFGSLVLIAAMADRRLAVAGALLVWPFVFDTLVTFSRRLIRGENVLAAHRQHLYQRLCLAGWTHGSVSLLYALLASTGTLLAAALLFYPGIGDWAVIFSLTLLAAGLWTFAKLQTTAWDDEGPPPPERSSIHDSALEGAWRVTIWPEEQAACEPQPRPVSKRCAS